MEQKHLRHVVHLDIDAFFASVEQRDDPKLRGRPVAVGTGVVASCSYEARRYGVRTGMRLAEACHVCRELIVVPGAYPRYEQAARCVLAICQEQTPVVEVAALDDLYLDIMGTEGLTQLADELREAVRAEVKLSVSLGSGTNKLVAGVATHRAKPGRHVHVDAGDERTFLAPWSVRILPGVGAVVARRLERLNVQRVEEMADMPRDLLRQMFGPTRGRTLHELAHGIDPRPVQPHKPQQSVGRRASFDPATADKVFLAAMLRYLLERACSWLRFHHLATRGLVLTLRYSDYESAEGRLSFRQATSAEQQLYEAAHERFARLYQRRLPLRFLGVELAPLTEPAQEPTLFVDDETERQQRLLAVKDAVRQRFGFTSLMNGSSLTLAKELDRDRENFRLRTPCLSR